MSVNKTILLGRVGEDPQSNDNLTNLSLATNKKFKNKQGELVEQTQWHRITLFSNLKDFADKFVKKGNLIYVECELQYSTYDKDGIKMYSTNLIANKLDLLASNKETNEPPF
jgi:single-strand DNA-binding protein